MKTNEAPEKIYLIRNITRPTSLNCTNDCRDKYLQEWYKVKEKDTDIEYTRTDAFIEKAINFVEMLGCGFTITDNITHTCYDKEQMIEDFKEYLKK